MDDAKPIWKPKFKPKESGCNGRWWRTPPCGLSYHHITSTNSVASDVDRVFLKQPVKPLTLGNMQHTVSRDLPTTKICASPAATTGVQCGSQMCDQHRKMQTDENCTPTNRATSSSAQGGRELMADQQGVRHMVPEDVTCTNATTDDEPLRRMANDDTHWVNSELPQSAAFPTKPEINPDMEHLGQLFSRHKITPHMGITPVAENRILLSLPESVTEMISGERAAQKLDEATAFLSKTGSEAEGQLALPPIALIRNDQQIRGRAGNTSPHVSLGEVVACIDCQIAISHNLHWISIDFGENLHIGGKRRMAMEEAERTERNQRAATHLSASYE